MNAQHPPGLPTALEALNSWQKYRLILLVAPAGSGKSALLRNWSSLIENSAGERSSAEPAVRLAWYDLGPLENDPVRFLAGLVSAFRDVGLKAAKKEMGNPPLESGVVEAINTLALFKGDLILVFDQYHHIYAPEIHAAVSLLLDYLPPNAHLVIACREEPPLPLPRLRARRQMMDIRREEPGLSK